MALIETDLIMMTKRGINRQMEIMGFRTGTQIFSVDFLTAAGTRSSSREFFKTADERGLKEALDLRDKQFGDLRTSDTAKQNRETVEEND